MMRFFATNLGEDDEESEAESVDNSTSVDAKDVGYDSICDMWFWGHADSAKEVPEAVPMSLSLKTAPLLFTDNPPFYQEFAKYVLCPHFLDKQAKGAKPGHGCPFLGGTAYLRHADVSKFLAEVPAQHASGEIERRNELGYLLLGGDAFPEPSRTLGLGNSVNDHRVQRKWFEHLLDPKRLPDRAGWIEEVKAFLASKRAERKFQVRKDVAKWWQQMLWKHILGETLSWEEASAFIKFQSQWLQCSITSLPASFLDNNPMVANLFGGIVKSKVWTLSELHRVQGTYRDRIKALLPSEVPSEHGELVAQGILEMFVFAGGLSVPQTIHCATSVLCNESLLPSPARVTEDNVEAFVYEVTRLFPAVQGFCFWRAGQRQVLSLNAALRDPAVWGDEANRFTLKDVNLYRQKHVGFANPAVSAPGKFDSKACPGYQLALDISQAFVLAVSCWQSSTAPGKPLVWWQPNKVPKPQGVHKKWFSDFKYEVQDWLDGDQTGENLLRGMGCVDLARLLYKIGMADAEDDRIGALTVKMGPKSDREAGVKLVACNAATRVFYQLSRKRFKELAERVGSLEPDVGSPKPHSKYFDLDFGEGNPIIRLPLGDSLKKQVRDKIAGLMGDVEGLMSKLLGSSLEDEIDASHQFQTKTQRCAAIMLCQQAFQRVGGDKPPPHSSARPDSYLPKAKAPFFDITTDESQVAIARCGMGQLFLRANDDPRLAAYGDVLCDVTCMAGFAVRSGFEKMGAAAVFKREANKWHITAIDWRHGNTIVKPSDTTWNHAKWVWRCSMITYMTAVHHLVQTHWLVANALSTSIRETLGPWHPVRRLLQVLTYNTPSINHNSALSLYPESGMLHRMSAFPYEELRRVFASGASNFRFRTWPQEYKDMTLPEDVKSKLPMFEDGLQVWSALYDFMAGYIGVYFKNDEDVTADKGLQEYWKFTCSPQYAQALPALSRTALIDQLTRGAFDVTAYHELVGDVVAYTTDPAGAALQVRPGADMADLQEFLQVNSLVAGTGTPMPMFVPSGEKGDEDWLCQLDLSKGGVHSPKHFEEVSSLYRTMMDRMREISQDVRRRNAPGGGREMPFGQMDPLNLERSVSL
mmetsp:Transcript_15068/g.40622  ORF Transcript_15068/g.40622 Transcript_15068/m.40622 type:complete len:1094 (-) Transcript_15068:78-3359(-)